MPQEIKHDDLYVVVISTKKERNQLYDLCVKYNIPILYPELFKEKKIQTLWGINKTGIGLVGTIVARYTPKNHIIHLLDKLNEIFNKY